MQEFITLILAAGAGTRMKSSLAKVAHPLCGRPMVSYVIQAAEQAGSQKTLIVLGHGAQDVKACLPESADYVLQKEQLGTGHAVMQARDLMKDRTGTVLVLCGDTPLISGLTLKKAWEYHQKQQNAITVLTARVDNPFGYGRIIRDDEENILGIVEEKDAQQDQKKIQEINSGMYFFDIQSLLKALDRLTNSNQQGEYYLTDTLKLIKASGEKAGAYLLPDSGDILGVNDRVQLAQAEKIMNKRIIEGHMRNGVTFHLPETTLVGAQVKIGSDTVIYPGTLLEGNVAIGEGCTIGPDSRIVDTRIGDHVHVVKSVVTGSQVDEGTKIGPFAYLRPGSRIGKHIKIGDFVEIKNAVIGDESKISHLTYVGDADVGKNVNLGCGVVVSNYDGVKKHRTTVGDNVFVGCNVNLVAPVTVKSNSYIAAGSTITEEVPENALAIARSRQTVIEDWVVKKGLLKNK